MLRARHTLPLTCAAAALLAFSAPISAQTSTTKQTATATTQTATTQNAGQALVEARKALNAVLNAPAPNKEIFDKLNDVKAQYMALEKAYSARGDWKTPYAAILQHVSELTAGATATGTSSTATAVTGATGTTGKTAPAKLDAAAINNLQAFAKALADFSSAMGGTATATVSQETGKTTVTTGATGTMGSSTTVTGTSTSGTTSSTTVTSTAAPPVTNPPAAAQPPASAAATTNPSSATATVTTPPAAGTQVTATAGATSSDPHLIEMSRLIAAALSSTATAAGADTVCVDRKTLESLQRHIQEMTAAKKPQ